MREAFRQPHYNTNRQRNQHLCRILLAAVASPALRDYNFLMIASLMRAFFCQRVTKRSIGGGKKRKKYTTIHQKQTTNLDTKIFLYDIPSDSQKGLNRYYSGDYQYPCTCPRGECFQLSRHPTVCDNQSIL